MFYSLVWIVFCVAILAKTSCAILCDIKGSALNCMEKSLNTIPTDVTANVDPEGVLKLELSNNNIQNLPRGSFELFNKLEELVLTNNGLLAIDDGAFDGLEQMLTLNLSNNQLSEIKSEIFKQNFNLQILILSNNQLESWDNFKITDLPSIQYLDISNNKFTYLPSDILELLQVHTTFTLVLDDNPWDCDNETLRKSSAGETLCGTQNETKTVDGDVRIDVTIGGNDSTIGYLNPPSETPPTNVCIVRSYKRNLLPIWLALAIVAGIIIGNGDRIYSWLQSKWSHQYNTQSIRRPDEETALK